MKKYRKKLKKGYSKRLFAKYSVPSRRNQPRLVQRGGTRL